MAANGEDLTVDQIAALLERALSALDWLGQNKAALHVSLALRTLTEEAVR